MGLEPRKFETILIANRGEIACRIIRSAKALGLKTIAVFSDADTSAPHVKRADQAINIGPPPVGESYLAIANIIKAAQTAGAQAIHPGYGFLSENAEFARACKTAGLTFIGPDAKAIELMGDKAKAKRRMIKAGVPCVPGYQGQAQDDDILLKEAKTIGFPLMVKAAAGGGGRGMRRVADLADLPSALGAARAEALNAFGSDIVILERVVQNPRHVEIQIFADQFGQTLHMGERDCSVQRRHQKVLEEAPCPVMTDKLRADMGACAVKAAQDIGYVGAGTVEFMLEPTGEFYFLEMNTRLQVEHPVTEMVTGLDLVALQIQIAQGLPLDLTQSDITLTGHAIEARLYAEDTAQGFLPATGKIDVWKPADTSNIRIDSGIETGSEVSPFYDPMLAKLIAYGSTREQARRRLIKALKDTAIFGVKTNKAFLGDALSHDDFATGQATTQFIAKNFPDTALTPPDVTAKIAVIAALLQYETARDQALKHSLDVACKLINWSSATKITTPYRYRTGNALLDIGLTPESERRYKAHAAETLISLEVLSRTPYEAVIEIAQKRYPVQYHISDPAKISLSIDGHSFDLINQNALFSDIAETAGAGAVVAPMHGALKDIFVKPGDKVIPGTRLAVLEAMKMQHDILAEITGTVTDIYVGAGAQVAAESLIIDIELNPKEEV